MPLILTSEVHNYTAKSVCLKDLGEMVFFRRNPKLFYVSSSTTTLSTTTVCYVSTNAAVVACGRRKRRAVLVDALDTLVPSGVTKTAKVEER